MVNVMYNDLHSGTLASSFSTLDAEIISLLVSTGCGVWQCSECGKVGKKGDLKKHIEAKHITNIKIDCPICKKRAKTRDSLRKHMKAKHNSKSWN